MAIHCKLSTILGEKRLKRADVVRETGLSKGTVHALYYDRVRRVDYGVLEKICKYLNCDLGDLLVYIKEEEG
jgi:putative transcriptional regulator